MNCFINYNQWQHSANGPFQCELRYVWKECASSVIYYITFTCSCYLVTQSYPVYPILVSTTENCSASACHQYMSVKSVKTQLRMTGLLYADSSQCLLMLILHPVHLVQTHLEQSWSSHIRAMPFLLWGLATRKVFKAQSWLRSRPLSSIPNCSSHVAFMAHLVLESNENKHLNICLESFHIQCRCVQASSVT